MEPVDPPRPAGRLRVIPGGARPREERLGSRDAVARALMEAGADLLLRRISDERAEAVHALVEEILTLFDRVDHHPMFMPVLERKLAELERLMRQTRGVRRRRG